MTSPDAPSLAPHSPLGDVVARGVRKRYGRMQVLRGADLTVAPGEVVGLEGPNGAGKTTLLRIVATLERADGGEVVYGDRPMRRWARRALRERIGVLGHESWLHPELSAMENLVFVARIGGAAPKAARDGAAHCLDLVGLRDARHRPVRQYSRGMRQRTALARLLVSRPALWLLDEPTTGLDAAGVELLCDLVCGAARAGAGVLVSSHDPAFLRRVCNRIVRLDRGRIGRVEAPPGRCARRDVGEVA